MGLNGIDSYSPSDMDRDFPFWVGEPGARSAALTRQQEDWVDNNRVRYSHYTHTRHLEGASVMEPVRVVTHLCPVKAKSRDGLRICIITPSGRELWVDRKEQR